MSAQPTKKILLIGECMIHLQKDEEGQIQKSYSGDTLNTATYLARLSNVHHTEVDYLTAVGQDQFSTDMVNEWSEAGIGCSQVRRLENKLPGLYYVHVDEAGERSFSYWRGEAAVRDLFKPETVPAVTSLAEYNYIYLSGISLAILDAESRARLISLIDEARQNGCHVCFDNNYRPRLWSSVSDSQHWYQEILKITDTAFLTFDDEVDLWGDAAIEDTLARYIDQPDMEIVLKCGEDPCVIKSPMFSGEVPALKIEASKVIDTNAAGDSFSAGYICGLLANTGSPEVNANIGHILAGTVIQHRGAVIPKEVTDDVEPSIQKSIASVSE